MEGITGYVYRNAHRRVFGGIEKYFTPFLTPNSSKRLLTREMQDVLPENNRGVSVVPQVLTREADHFLWCAEKLSDLGYREVNLNLGCPSRTVTVKGKGAGFLAQPRELSRFLDEVCARCPIRVSVKMRIGMESEQEFPQLLDLVSAYPLSELILHPRLGSQQYLGVPREEAFEYALDHCKVPLVYNGDLFDAETIRCFRQRHPRVQRCMLGRGLIANPALALEAAGNGRMTAELLRAFLREVRSGYTIAFHGDERVTLYHLKEMWSYLSRLFPERQKEMKAIRKASRLNAYDAAVEVLFDRGSALLPRQNRI